nr:hypothetical protein [uncultured Gellertiella sp.]
MTGQGVDGEAARRFLAASYPALALEPGPPCDACLADLASPTAPGWRALLDWQQHFAPGVSPRGEATLFLGQASFFLGVALIVPLFFGGELVLAPTAAEVGLSLLPLNRNDITGTVRLRIDTTKDRTGDASDVLESLIEPLVTGLRARTRLSHAALWRVAGDGVAAALMDIGRKRGDPVRAKQLFDAILKRPDSRFRNPQLRWPVEDITGVLLRGGCCRIHETGNTPLCPGCVLMRGKMHGQKAPSGP